MKRLFTRCIKITKLGVIGLLVFFAVPFGITYYYTSLGLAIILGLTFSFFYLLGSIKIIMNYENGLLFTLGKYSGILTDGLKLILPLVEQINIVSLRIQVADVPPQEIITKDNIPLNINAVAYYRVSNPEYAILRVENYKLATFQIAQTTLRNVIGQFEMDDILQHRERINKQLLSIIGEEIDAWGIEATIVEVKDVELPSNLKRAMAKQAEAERERRARVILASGELEASDKLTQAGQKMATQPGAMQLRVLQTIQEISIEKNSTILFPFPVEIAELFKLLKDKKKL